MGCKVLAYREFYITDKIITHCYKEPALWGSEICIEPGWFKRAQVFCFRSGMVSQKMCLKLRNIENAQDIVHAYLTMNREGIKFQYFRMIPNDFHIPQERPSARCIKLPKVKKVAWDRQLWDLRSLLKKLAFSDSHFQLGRHFPVGAFWRPSVANWNAPTFSSKLIFDFL